MLQRAPFTTSEHPNLGIQLYCDIFKGAKLHACVFRWIFWFTQGPVVIPEWHTHRLPGVSSGKPKMEDGCTGVALECTR